MSVDIPTLKRAEAPQQPAEAVSDWRKQLVTQAKGTASALRTRERTRNPMIPDNFLDLHDAGFPADLVVLPVQIPRPAVPGEMAQYRDMLNYQWLHVPWNVISKNGGEDGKANVPGATPHDMGGGHFVAVLAGHYLMFASREQYEARRASNTLKAGESLQYKMDHLEEQNKASMRSTMRHETDHVGPMTLEQLLEYEQVIGDEAALKGVRITRE